MNFDALGGGASVNTVDGVNFFSDSGGLTVYSGNTPSPDNYVGNNNVLFRPLEEQVITVTLPEAANAVGIFVVHSATRTDIVTGDTLSNDDIRISSGGAISNSQDAISFADYNDGTSAFFIGLRDDSGENSISAFTLNDPNGSAEYFFDSQTRFVVTAVPEPGMLAMCGMIACGVMTRRRKRT